MASGAQWRDYFQYLKQRMVRLKETDPGDMKTELRRCLSTPQLTFLGVGNTIGVGIYVLLGVIAKEYAGPSTTICFLVAIAVTLMNALVYSEFSSSVTQTGAAYTFFYKVGGEFLAFICGWLMIISGLCSGCVGARAWSGLLDSFFNHSIQSHTTAVFGEIQFGVPFAESLDVMACAFQIVLTVIVSCNVRCSSVLNTALTVLTVSVLVFVAVAGPLYGSSSNFINEGHGGLFPFGVAGVVKGASMAIYACSGFEVVSISAEEAKNPQRSVPRAIVFELLIVAMVYVGASIGILFLIPYWMIDTKSPLSSAFDYNGMTWGKFIVTLGPLFSFFNLQMLNMYGASRIIYRMASDGLFFGWFLKVNKRTGVPVNSVICVGILTSTFSLMLDLSFLIEVTILLMLITFIFLGSALIKLKVTKTNNYSNSLSRSTPENAVENDKAESSGCEVTTANSDQNDSSPLDTSLSNNTDGKEESILAADSNGLEQSDINNGALALIADDSSREKFEDESDSEGEDDVLFTQKVDSEKLRQHNGQVSVSVNPVDEYRSFRLMLADKFSPFVPGVLSVNNVIVLHWLSCVGLAFQMNYGWQDLLDASVIALFAFSTLLFLLVVLTFLLWTQKIDAPNSGFETPLMPLVPTLSIVASSILFFSSAHYSGFIEMIVLVLIGSLLYFILVRMDMKAATASESQDTEQTLSLIGNDEGSDNDEL